MPLILIVDDQSDNLYLLRAMLEGHGYQTREAHNGMEALQLAREQLPDLIVTDLLMPVMDGYTLLRQVRADAGLRQVPIMVYTATYLEPDDERLAWEMGADAFIVKPAEPEQLLSRIRKMLRAPHTVTSPPADNSELDSGVLLKYNEVVVRKLEKKVQELEQSQLKMLDAIAQQQQAETSSMRIYDLMRAVIDGITDAIFIKDVEGKYLLCNQACADYIGRTVEEILGKDDTAFFPEADARLIQEHDRQVRQSNQNSTREECLTAAGVTRTYLATKVPYRDATGRVIGTLGISRDISDRKRDEVLLRLQEKAIQTVSQGILVVDPHQPDMPIIFANAGFERITGYKTAEVVGRNCRMLQGRGTDRHAVARIRKALTNAEGIAVEILNYRKNGSAFWNSITISPVFDDAGQLLYFVGVQADVTSQKKLEDQLRQAQKMEAVGQLAGGVAHDFNNLLTVISGNSEFALAQPGLAPQLLESIQEIQDAGLRAAELTQKLLAFSRQSLLEPRVLNLNQLINTTGRMLRRLIGEDIELELVLQEELPSICIDPTQMDQVLLNLAVNARDAMPKGGKLTIETVPVVLTDEYALTHPDCAVGPHVMLAVTDSGCGIAPDVLPRIFEPFFTTKGSGRGTGLGLPMVMGIVQQSGGCVHVYSEPGQGTTFKLYFPVAEASAMPRTTADSAIGLSGHETILLVEDEEGVRKLARRTLMSYGYHVLDAANSAAALQISEAHSENIHLLLTDVVMPAGSGPELAGKLKSLRPNIQVLFTSGYTDDTVVRHGLLHAEVAFIQKPFSPMALVRKVRNLLDQTENPATH